LAKEGHRQPPWAARRPQPCAAQRRAHHPRGRSRAPNGQTAPRLHPCSRAVRARRSPRRPHRAGRTPPPPGQGPRRGGGLERARPPPAPYGPRRRPRGPASGPDAREPPAGGVQGRRSAAGATARARANPPARRRAVGGGGRAGGAPAQRGGSWAPRRGGGTKTTVTSSRFAPASGRAIRHAAASPQIAPGARRCSAWGAPGALRTLRAPRATMCAAAAAARGRAGGGGAGRDLRGARIRQPQRAGAALHDGGCPEAGARPAGGLHLRMCVRRRGCWCSGAPAARRAAPHALAEP
jgi:hypothetical protein